MNAILRTASCLLFCATGVVAETPPATRVVVLDNENLLEGQVTRVAEGYEIRRAVGGDVTVPAERVLAVVADRRAAFGFVATRANRGDADERLRLAKWCAANGLGAEALAEARTAARMRPGFRAAEQMIQALESAAATTATPSAVEPAKHETPKGAAVADIVAIEYNTESFPLFAAKVNTVLINACANCHARDDAKSFRLTRTGGRSGATRNLHAALPHVSAAEPTASVLLTKALTAHGNAKDAPLKSRSHPAYQTLEEWVRLARLPEGSAEPRPLPDLGPPRADEAKPGVFGESSTTLPGQPVKQRGDDPFDPALFNNARPVKK